MNEAVLLAASSQPNPLTSAQALVGLAVVVLSIGIAWGSLKQSVKHLDDDIKNNIKPDLKDVRERFAAVEAQSKGLTDVNSPVSLTDTGKKYLSESGLKDYIDNNKDMLKRHCSKYGEMKTPYDVQQSAFSLFDAYDFPEEVENKLKTYVFNEGATFDAIRRVGAIYFRDICLDNLGFKPEDIDNKPKKKS